MLLFQYLVNALEGDFVPRNRVYGDCNNIIAACNLSIEQGNSSLNMEIHLVWRNISKNIKQK
ncbi:hypothetical protein NC652_010595 [Populus alba x Populus x berolinensis]|nr:hypothetical protein NC652_010595 [Populus alba x Populus x berolinensis]